MKIIVFGATGGTGVHVVQQALEQGHKVTAFVRDPRKLNITNHHLKIAQGDVLQPTSIDQAMPGHDTVICCLGKPATKAGKLRSAGTQNIIHSAEKHGVSRLICQTSLGYADSKPVLKFTPFVFREIIVPFLLKRTFEDHLLQEELVRKSNLNWTIVRPGTLTEGQRTGAYKTGFRYDDHTVKVKVSRADVADFMVKCLADNRSFRQILGISY
jgi:putative NADH-flavin reductase